MEWWGYCVRQKVMKIGYGQGIYGKIWLSDNIVKNLHWRPADINIKEKY